jgi:Co/Zn/Cd efflux system component
MFDRIVTYADPITTAIIVFIVVLWIWPRLKRLSRMLLNLLNHK